MPPGVLEFPPPVHFWACLPFFLEKIWACLAKHVKKKLPSKFQPSPIRSAISACSNTTGPAFSVGLSNGPTTGGEAKGKPSSSLGYALASGRLHPPSAGETSRLPLVTTAASPRAPADRCRPSRRGPGQAKRHRLLGLSPSKSSPIVAASSLPP